MQVRDEKASSAGSTSGQGSRLGSVRRAFATRGASRDADGSGASSGGSGASRRLIALACLLGTLGILVVVAGQAFADTSFGEQESPEAGYLSNPEGVAVDQSSGDVYVGTGFGHRVAKFDANGNSLFAFGLGVEDGAEEEQTCTVTCQPSPFTENSVKVGLLAEAAAVAVDPVNGDVYVTDGNYRRVEKFDSSGAFLYALGGDVVAHGPDNSTNNEVQTVTVTAEGGTFKLKFDYPYTDAYAGSSPPNETASLPYNATAAEVEAALNATPTVSGSFVPGGEVSVTGGPGDATGSSPYEITFEGNIGGDDVPQLQNIDDCGFGESCLTGANHGVAIATVTNGGGGEVCKPASGDVCKGGGDFGSGANGTFNWSIFEHTTVAVGATGTVYIGDANRVQEFSPEGAYIGQVNVPGGGATEAVTVDGSGNVYVVSEGVSGVQEFNSSGTLVRTLHPAGQAKQLTVDGSDDVFVGTEVNGGEPTAAYQIPEYNSAGTLIAQLHSTLIKPHGGPFHVGGIAVGNTAGKLYVSNLTFNEEHPVHHVVVIPLPEPGPPAVGEEEVTNIQPTTAILHAVVNPEGFDTNYHFQYVDDAHFQSGGFSNPATQSTTSTVLALVSQDDPVQAAISSLTPGTVYHFRVVAESIEGTLDGADETFETLPSVSVRNFTTQTVGPELVTLKAELNPNGQFSNYTIHYGKDTNYTDGSSEGTLGIGNEFVKKEVTFSGLAPNTTYHYQLIAENGNGEIETTDQTFTTELSSAEERARESCPNTNLREENSSLTLPDCRAYEQVSPTDKHGYPILGSLLAPSGERASLESLGSFAGEEAGELNRYFAHRTEAGWLTIPAEGRPDPNFQPRALEELTAELDTSVFPQTLATTAQEAEESPSPNAYYFGRPDGSFVKATPTLNILSGFQEHGNGWDRIIAQSTDLSRLYISTGDRLLPEAEDPRPDGTEGDRIYEISGAGGPSPSMRLVAEVPISGTGCKLDSQFGQTLNSASADGTTLFYDAPVNASPGDECAFNSPIKVGIFARTGEAPPVEVSTPPSSQCHSPAPCSTASLADAHLYGISPDGTRAWFTTTQPLVDSDTDATNDLYLAKLENGNVTELVQVSEGEATPSHLTPGQGADLQGVVSLSQDGQVAYFVATGVLTTHENALHQSAAQGAYNLYAYDSQSGETKFVTRLCSGPEESGAVADLVCPSTLEKFIPGNPPTTQTENDVHLWSFGALEKQSQLTPDGRFLLFKGFGRFTSDDTDNAADIYRYDLQTGQIIRVSFGRRGNDANGNDNAYKDEIGIASTNKEHLDAAAEDNSRSISTDGSVAIFKTPAPLVSHDTNTGNHPGCYGNESGCDVYEWEEQGHGTCNETGGCVSLVSSGVDPHAVSGQVISASGEDITFITPRALVPNDADGVPDVYDARVNGGFHATHPPIHCGSGEICRPQHEAEPEPPKFGSEQFVGTGNAQEHLQCAKGRRRVVRHGHPRCVSKRHRPKGHKQKHRKGKHMRGRASRGGAK